MGLHLELSLSCDTPGCGDAMHWSVDEPGSTPIADFFKHANKSGWLVRHDCVVCPACQHRDAKSPLLRQVDPPELEGRPSRPQEYRVLRVYTRKGWPLVFTRMDEEL